MICPKCGARLAQGSTICPICGTKIRPSKVKVQDNYEEQPDQGYDSDSDDDYEENLNEITIMTKRMTATVMMITTMMIMNRLIQKQIVFLLLLLSQ